MNIVSFAHNHVRALQLARSALHLLGSCPLCSVSVRVLRCSPTGSQLSPELILI